MSSDLAGRRLYLCTPARDDLAQFAGACLRGGVDIVQLRDKRLEARQLLESARVLRGVCAGFGVPFIMNDRPDLALEVGADGVHVGQDDLSFEDARRVVGPQKIVGVSTHTPEQVRAADLTAADYVAIGPVFATTTKADTEPVVGLEGVRRARTLTTKPLVAIGGITRANARSAIEAGADSVAVISGLLAEGESVEQVARDFLELLR